MKISEELIVLLERSNEEVRKIYEKFRVIMQFNLDCKAMLFVNKTLDAIIDFQEIYNHTMCMIENHRSLDIELDCEDELIHIFKKDVTILADINKDVKNLETALLSGEHWLRRAGIANG